jgi:hypothetical protein
MRDERGLYYYPYPANKQTRMYVKKSRGVIWFRLWNSKMPELWDEHDWVPYDAILKASEMRKKGNSSFDPSKAYDINIAEDLLSRYES